MLEKPQSLTHDTYGFQFKGEHQKRIAGIHSVGWEEKNNMDYDWDGLTRQEQDVIIFQYTLRGFGHIRIKNKTYTLKPGKAFFIKVPSNHRYYLPQNSKNWEFIHLTLFGEETIRLYNAITEKAGHILDLNISETPITHILNLLKNASDNKIHDAYETSALAYSFLMTLQQHNQSQKNMLYPDSIAQATYFIKNHYNFPITLDDIVNSSGLSKYHFTRLFRDTVGLTPIKYLAEIRINKAIELLKDQSLKVEDIALKVGFANSNYFCKVFRSSIGIPPGEYRRSKSYMPVDYLIRDY